MAFQKSTVVHVVLRTLAKSKNALPFQDLYEQSKVNQGTLRCALSTLRNLGYVSSTRLHGTFRTFTLTDRGLRYFKDSIEEVLEEKESDLLAEKVSYILGPYYTL